MHACIHTYIHTYIYILYIYIYRPGTFSVVSGRSLYIIGKFGKVKWGIILEM